VRTSTPALLVVSIFVNIGMYLERFLIVGVMLGRNETAFRLGRLLCRGYPKV